MTASATDRDILITRVYDAPLALVWDAFTLDAHAAHWWGPRGFTITTHHKDVRPGGSWSYTMHGPDGTDWPNFTRYLEVEPRALLVYDHGATSADAAPMFRVTARFRAVEGGTELSLCMTLPTPEAARDARAFIKAAGGNATWDRLAEYLEKQVSDAEVFVINRSVDAPIDTVFELFTTPEHLAEWLPPAGFTMTVDRGDISEGGELLCTMTNGAVTMHARFQYVTVARPDRLAYTQCFTDAHGRVARHPGVPTWPETLHVGVQFTAEGPAQTRITLRTAVVGSPSPEELATFVAERTGMTQGWTGSFDKLEARVAVRTWLRRQA